MLDQVRTANRIAFHFLKSLDFVFELMIVAKPNLQLAVRPLYEGIIVEGATTYGQL